MGKTKPFLVIITDCIDVAFNEIRANILNHLGKSEVKIEPLVCVPPFSLINATFVLRLLAEVYPTTEKENQIFCENIV
jgi:hypothetical protein